MPDKFASLISDYDCLFSAAWELVEPQYAICFLVTNSGWSVSTAQQF